MERLQKIISAAGVASRRKAEELITSGLVQVNGQTITELGAKADAEKDHIRVNGKLLKISGHHVYILLNKPKGYVTTLSDPEGRPTIVDLLRGVKQRVYPVGRLDYASEGLLLLTNDGELANALTKTASHVPKTYLVKVSGQPNDAALEQLRAGIELPDRKGLHSRTAPAGIQLVHKAENPWYEVTLIEGRNRQVRAMFEQTGHHVEKLKRVRYGPFTLDVHPGEFRNLTLDEVEQLKAAVQRGAGGTPEAAVRPVVRPRDNAARHLTAELREESAVAKGVPAPPPTFRDKPKRAPKLFGASGAAPGKRPDQAFRKGPRPFAPRPGGARPGAGRFTGGKPASFRANHSRANDSRAIDSRSRDSRPSDFRSASRPRDSRSNDFRKKAPQKASFRGSGGPGASFQARPREGRPGPAPAGNLRKPVWNKGASSRPERPAPRPDWKKPGSASRPGAGTSAKTWGKPANSNFAKPRAFDTGKPDRLETRAPSKDKDRWRNRPGAAAGGPRRDGKAPFWQAADKRRPGKPKPEGDGEQRPSTRRGTAEPRSEVRTSGEKPGERKAGPSKFRKARPNKKRF